MKKRPRIVVITGAESTGKSTLAQGLASHFHAPWIPEAARDYVENLKRQYTYQDVEQIALMQTDQLNTHLSADTPVVFADTWLIITKVWFEVVFNKYPEWIEKTLLNTPVDLFLVCKPDIPWIPDPVRENGGEKRLVLHQRYLEEIRKHHFKFSIISGWEEKRLHSAIVEVEQLLRNLSPGLYNTEN